jgi:hypothetical protein
MVCVSSQIQNMRAQTGNFVDFKESRMDMNALHKLASKATIKIKEVNIDIPNCAHIINFCDNQSKVCIPVGGGKA